jgi:hypothetical protein
VSEKVCENLFDETIDGTELLFDQSVNGWFLLEAGDLTEGGSDWKENAVYLGILVDKHQSVWDVMVTFTELR